MNNVRIESGTPVRREIGNAEAYRIARVPDRFDLTSLSDPSAWIGAQVAEINSFHPDSSEHRPKTRAKVLHDPRAIHVRFDVEDRYVRSVHTEHQSRVSRDSCVEFFLQPAGSLGYFNFEVNAGGTMLVYFIEDPDRGEDGVLFKRFSELPVSLIQTIPIYHTLPSIVEPEIESPIAWTVAFSIPRDLIERYAPAGWSRRDVPWRCNFHKCGDETSHPHWASWADIGQTLRFHQPDRFGQLVFDLRGTPDLQPISTESTA